MVYKTSLILTPLFLNYFLHTNISIKNDFNCYNGFYTKKKFLSSRVYNFFISKVFKFLLLFCLLLRPIVLSQKSEDLKIERFLNASVLKNLQKFENY